MTATSPAFAAISHDDERGKLWITAILSLIFVVLTLSARVYVRKHMLGQDDYASIAAVALGVAQYATVFKGMPLGLGTSKPSVMQGNEHKAGRVYLASAGLFISALYMAKLAVLFTTERLLAANMRTVRNICVLIRFIIGLAAIASLITFSIDCSIGNLLAAQGQSQCNGQIWRWTAVTIMDGLTELCILGTFYSIVWSLQMSKNLKITVTTLLGMRIICPVFTAIYTTRLSIFISSPDPAVRIILPLIWQQIAMGYSLMSVLLIALLPFLKSFHTGMGVDVRNLTKNGSAGTARDGSGAGYRLDQLSKQSKRSNVAVTQPAEEEEAVLGPSRWTGSQPKEIMSTSRVEVESADASLVEDMVIQKTVDWSVQYEEDKH